MRPTRITLVLTLLALSAPGLAQVPPTMIASLGKQILQNIVFGSLKGELFGALADMGCKGSTIAGLAAAASTGRGGATRMLTSQARTSAGGGPVAMRSAGGGAGVPAGMPPGMGGAGAMDPATIQKMMEMMQQQSGGRAPQMSPQQLAMMQQVMGQMQGAMAQPLSRTETAAVFDDLAELGLLNDKMRAEAKDCIALAPPGAGDQIGATGAMLKSTVIPAAQDAKERMAATTPEEQKELADAMVDALNSASASDRKAFFDGLGLGFFPPAVVDQVRAQVKP